MPEPQPGIQGEVTVATIRGEKTLIDLSQDFDPHRNQIRQWRDTVFVGHLRGAIKYEGINLRTYASISDAIAEIGRYFGFYNNRRSHPSLDRKTPDKALSTSHDTNDSEKLTL